MAQVEPLFSNDLSGFIKILAIIVSTVLVPLAALVIYFLKRGPTQDILQLRVDLNGLGERLTATQEQGARLDERVNAINQLLLESQRDVMEAIRESGARQLSAVYEVKVDIARLQERNSLGECLVQFGKSIEKLIDMQRGSVS